MRHKTIKLIKKYCIQKENYIKKNEEKKEKEKTKVVQKNLIKQTNQDTKCKATEYNSKEDKGEG